MRRRVTILDHMDSFTYNLAHLFRRVGASVTVVRSDRTTWKDMTRTRPQLLVLSPGPGHPGDADLAHQALARLSGTLPVFGVCLGMQCIGLWAGGQVEQETPVHGKPARVHHDGTGIFTGLPQPMTVGRYHSLHLSVVPAELAVTARTDTGIVMAVRHRSLPVAGVQFHPESFLTDAGLQLAENVCHDRL